MNDVPVAADPIQDEMTEKERRALLQAIIEELTESGVSNALGAIGDLDNKSTKELAERAARMIERAQQNRQVDLFLSGTRWHSINQRWQRRLGRGPDGAMTESLAARKARQALQEAASIDPSQSYASARQVFENARRYGKAAGFLGKVIDAGGALYSGDANKVMRTIASVIAGGIATALFGLGAAALIGSGAPVAIVAVGAAATALIGYGGSQVGEWLWDRWGADAFNDLLDRFGWRDEFNEAFKDIGDYLKDLVDKASNAISDLWERAKNWFRRSDPLVLDLDGDGIELVAADGAVLFDHNGDRITEATGWVAPDDGFLVIDKNGNGQIDDGNELFGDGNPDAFHDPDAPAELSAGIRALRRYDSNRDGVFDAADEAYGQVRVWRDLNQDGISQEGELFTLVEVGIQSINLNPVSTTDVDLGNGNVADSTGQFTRTDGSQGHFYDMLLANNHIYKVFA